MIDKSIKIRKESDKDYKYDFVKKVLNALPEWFEFAQAILQYAEAARDYDTYILSLDDEDLGFLCVKNSSVDTIDLYCLGIFKKYHSLGLGGLFLDEVLNLYRKNFKLVQVKTLAKGLDKFYDRTIDFYKAKGFLEIEVFDEIWGKDNPCLLMVKSL